MVKYLITFVQTSFTKWIQFNQLLNSWKLNGNARCFSNRVRRTKREVNNLLSEMPEWSYLDGRNFGPPSIKQKYKYLHDQELAQTIIDQMKDLQDAKKFS